MAREVTQPVNTGSAYRALWSAENVAKVVSATSSDGFPLELALDKMNFILFVVLICIEATDNENVVAVAAS